MPKLSIIIPSREEKHLQKTIDSIFENAEGDIEVLVGLDDWGIRPITKELKEANKGYEDRLTILTASNNAGQRATTNVLVGMSKAKYILKCDAHVQFSPGFDVKMMEDMDSRTILAPRLLCLDEDSWTPRHTPMSSSYAFDTDLVFQYNVEAENQDPVNETPCLQGSAWMVERKNYWEWELGDESLGSWGMQAAELGIKAYLNGGVCKTTKKCFYAHLFREDEKDFPYKRDKTAIKATRDEFKKRFKTQDIAGLIRKYDFPCDWTRELVRNL